MRDDLSGLNALLAVAEKRSFTAAAAELRVTPSAVSQTIRALEERVGVRLLQRTTRSVGLTEAGARFLARLKPAMEGVHEAFESLGELRDRPAGVLRLALPKLGYDLVLAPKLPAFLAAYPEIDLDISIDDAFSNIVGEGFDAGMRIGEMVEREMVAVRVSGDLRMAVVGSPAYFAARGKPKRPRDLQAHECINYRRRTSGVVYRWEFKDGRASGARPSGRPTRTDRAKRGRTELTENGKDIAIAVNGRLLLNDGEVMARAALDGLGLAYLLDRSVHEHVVAKRLVRVLEPYCEPFPGFFLYYPSRTHIAPKLQALVDFLKVGRSRRG